MPHTADTLHVVGWLATPRAPTAGEVDEVCNSDTDPKKPGLGCTELRGKDWKIYAPDEGNSDWRCNNWAFLAPPAPTTLDENGKPMPFNHWVMNNMWNSIEDLRKAR